MFHENCKIKFLKNPERKVDRKWIKVDICWIKILSIYSFFVIPHYSRIESFVLFDFFERFVCEKFHKFIKL